MLIWDNCDGENNKSAQSQILDSGLLTMIETQLMHTSNSGQRHATWSPKPT